MHRPALPPLLDLTAREQQRQQTAPPRAAAVSAVSPSLLAGLLSIDEFEEALGVVAKTRQAYVKRGLPEIVIGRRRFYDVVKCRAWILSHEHRAHELRGRAVSKRIK